MILTPGAYLKYRRTAAGLSIADVAARLTSEPRIAEHDRAEWLELLEADAVPASWATIVALYRIYRFDLTVLGTLAMIAQGDPVALPRLCRICACSEWVPCVVDGRCCSWVEIDLCSACAAIPAAIGIAA